MHHRCRGVVFSLSNTNAVFLAAEQSVYTFLLSASMLRPLAMLNHANGTLSQAHTDICQGDTRPAYEPEAVLKFTTF